MNYEGSKQKLKTIHLNVFDTEKNIDKETLVMEKVIDEEKKTTINSFKGSYTYDSDWENWNINDDATQGSAYWEVILNPFIENFIPFVKYAIIYKHLSGITTYGWYGSPNFFESEPIENDEGEEDETLKKITLYLGIRRKVTVTAATVEYKILLRISNENTYV